MSCPARRFREVADSGQRTARLRVQVSRVLVLGGLAAYNWWVVVLFHGGLLKSPNGFFSDLEATGQPDASLFQHFDLAASLLLLAALLVRGPSGRRVARRVEWAWLLAFALAGGVGAREPYACAEGTSPVCRSLEWHFKLPPHHYVHIVAGIVEFATVTVAAVLARRRTLGERTPEGGIYRSLVVVFALSYPLLGAAYLTDRLGAFIEPVFFLAFSVMVATEVFEPAFVAAAAAPRVLAGPTGPRQPSARGDAATTGQQDVTAKLAEPTEVANTPGADASGDGV